MQFCLVTKLCPTPLQPHGLQPARFLCPWDFPGKNTGVGCHFLLQGVFPTKGSSPHLTLCRWTLLSLSYQGSPGRLFSSVQFSCSVVSNSLRPHEPQHARPPCPAPTPRVYPNLCPSSQWCHPTISSSVIPFSSCLQSFPGSGSFPMSQLFTSCGQSIGVSVSVSNEHPGLISFRMDWLDLLAVQGTLKSLLQHHSSKASILQRSFFFIVQLSHPYLTSGKTIALTRQTGRLFKSESEVLTDSLRPHGL